MKQIKLKTFDDNLYYHSVYLYKRKYSNGSIKDSIFIESTCKDEILETRINYPVFYTSDSWGLDYPEVLDNDNDIYHFIKRYCLKINNYFNDME